MSGLKTALLSHPDVFDAHILIRTDRAGRERRVAYVVPSGVFSAESIRRHLASRAPGEAALDAIVAIPRLPVDASGRVDVAQLASVPVVDDSMSSTWEKLLSQQPDIDRAAVVSSLPRSDSGRLHLDDILPARGAARDGAADRDDGPEGALLARPGVMAIADGGPLPPDPEAPAVLGEALLRAAERHADSGVVMVDKHGHTRFQSYAALCDRALQLLAVFQANGFQPGDRAILQLRDPALHFRAFWACVLGGIIPVTVAIPPDYDPDHAVVRKLQNVWSLLEQPIVLTEAALRDGITRVLPGSRLAVIEETQSGPHGRVHPAKPTDVVFHQLTSGSTGTPKCIQETHAGIIAHIRASSRENGYHAGDVTLNWLPFDHVVPILTFHLKDVYLGCRQIHVQTDRVLAEPLSWLDLIAEHRVTRTWAPNFAFKMVADAVKKRPSASWDLGSLRTIMNAGEMVTLPAVREFLAAVGPFGVQPTAVQPAFGMAEACTCMTYNNDFDLDRSALRARASAEGDLRACPDESRAAVFMDLGPPCAGVAIRITDKHNQLVPEGRIGRFQIKGAVITPGYLLNPAANAEASVGDGWFNTGDQGFILGGRLYLTGREKEVIIVRGANFYAYEIEDVVSRVEGVAPTWAAACSWADPESATEGLAIFFVAKTAYDEAAVARKIRSQVAAALGPAPSIVLPVAMEDFPKTTSGKIQRTQLKARLAGAGLREASKRSDHLLSGEHGVPDWFFRPVWQPLASHAERPAPKSVLVVTEDASRGAALSAALGGAKVAESISGSPDAIVVLWPSARADETTSLPALFRSIAPLANRPEGVRLLVVTRGGLPVGVEDEIVPERSLARALAKVAAEEMPGLSTCHVDVQAGDPDWTARVAAELRDAGRERVVAYRHGRRLVPRLARHRPTPRAEQPLQHGGAYLISGGLGGIGVELAKWLASQFAARLLVVGRAPAIERSSALGALAAAGTEVTYAQLDVADAGAVADAVRTFEQKIGAPLSGIFHLAGAYQTRLLADESDASFAASLRAKVDGANALASLLESRPACAFYAFSSINAYFGGLMVSAYTAANLYLESLVHELRRKGRRAAALAWSTWDDLGMNAGNLTKERLAEIGYRAIAPAEGLNSMLACLADAAAPAVCLIGLDAGRPRIAREIVEPPAVEPSFLACFESHLDVYPTSALRALDVRDDFGTPVPVSFRHLRQLPVDSAGAVDRAALEAQLRGRREPQAERPTTEVQRRLHEIFREVLGLERVGIHDNFFDLGGSSLLLARVQSRIRDAFGRAIDSVEMFRFPTIAGLAQRITGDGESPSEPRPRRARPANSAIAVIAMACRFPKAPNLEAYWQNLVAGRECITRLDDAELLAEGVSPELLRNPRYVKAAGLLDDVDRFDASFFGCSAGEAEAMDPQHRLFMEIAWEALESAGCNPRGHSGAIGVFAGTTLNSYSLDHHPRPELDMDFFSDLVATDREFIATRLAYKLGLRGPAVNVQTACSTGLVAIHLACQSLLQGDSDLALAGAASIRVPHRRGHLYQEGGIFSPDGHCRTFDASANGTVFGNGAGVVLLKPLEDALRDGDPILAVIRGTAINNDGSNKAGFTAPCQDGQVEVIRQALDRAGLRATDIDYVEAHGTGTSLGDPIEVAALAQVFAEDGARAGSGACYLGSVKPSIGHLDAAAGMAGFIKTALMLSRGMRVPTIHYQRPNPKLAIERTPFQVATQCEPWQAVDRPVRAGVSAFGIGGTNAHAVLEQAPIAAPAAASVRPQVLMISAKTETALQALSDELARSLETEPQRDLADVAYTLQVGRARFDHRRAIVASTTEEAAKLLRAGGPREDAGALGAPVFLFPGQGAQWPGMAASLHRHIPAFAQELDALLALPETPAELRSLLLDPSGDPARLAQTELAQPGVFAVSLALARVLCDHWGIRPAALSGHSLGEYVAATLAGVFSTADAMRVVVARGRLMQAAPAGIMLSIPLPAREIANLLDDCEIAAVNGAEQTVVSGSTEAVASLEARLAKRGVEGRRLHTSHAFHSRLMDGVMAPLRRVLESVTLKAPSVPFVSNLTGTWITPAQATDPAYWVEQMRRPVLFAEGAQTLLAKGHRLFVEVGPGTHLGTLIRRQKGFGDDTRAWVTAPHPSSNREPYVVLLETLARLDFAGSPPDWRAVHGSQRRRVALPTHPFERRRYWHADTKAPEPQKDANGRVAKRPDPADWLYRSTWKRAPGEGLSRRRRTPITTPVEGRWMVFATGASYEKALLAGLESRSPIIVRPGPGFRRIDDTQFEIDPTSPEDHLALFRALGDAPPDRIAHLWSLADHEGERALQWGFHALMYLVQALVAETGEHPVHIGVLGAETEDVLGHEPLVPEKVAARGICGALTVEYPRLTCFHADVLRADLAGEGWVAMFLRDMASREITGKRAYRGAHRWIHDLERFDPRRESLETPRLREQGVYLVTGGLGGIGLSLAEHLGRTLHAKLALVSRRALPPQEAWSDSTDPVVKRLESLRRAGVELVHHRADVTDVAAMTDVIAQITRRFGRIHGVIHAAAATPRGAFRMIAQTNEQDWTRELAPKLLGTRVLAKVLPDDLDFCLVDGSIDTELGSRGSSVEAAANLASMAIARDASTSYPWIVVDWDHWSLRRHSLDEGSTGDVLFNLDLVAQGDVSMTPEEGQRVFEQVLALASPDRVIVSAADFDARARALREQESVVRAPMPVRERLTGKTSSARHARPATATPYAAPADGLEEALCELWGELLGLDQIGIHDNFFDLGGDSLLFLKLGARLREAHAVDMGSLFGSPTVAQIAALLRDAGVNELPDGPAPREAVKPAVPTILENQFVVGQDAGAHEKKAQMRKVYDAVTRQLDTSGVAQHAIFLNYGYKENHLPQRSRVELPERLLNKNCIKLVLELFGDYPFDEDTRFLDVGCGRGGTISVLNTYFRAKQVFGLDLSPEAVAFDRRTHTWPNTQFVQGDAENLPFADASFDVVTNVESSHSYPDLRAFYREVYRVLAPGGRFLYTDLFPTSMVDECVSYLRGLGFSVADDRDITTNVLRSCDEVGTAHFNAFAAGNDAEALGSFLGSPGSKIYNDMERGYSTYRIYELRK